MNILVPDSWIKEFLKTKISPKETADYLSLCSQSVEKTSKIKDDFIYDIEITTNRPDCLSVYGIARELNAILTNLKIPSKLKPYLDTKQLLIKSKTNLPLEVKISDNSLCPRFTAVILDKIKIKPSPAIIKERLEKVNIRSLNNVIDITNYQMVETGQPMHAFDYDKILNAKMVLRKSKEKETVITLDGQERILREGSIIIEDGKGRIIDLCGIMGAKNSAVDENTKRVLLFVQTYDPIRIRKTCQQLSFRTEASSRFERGINPEGISDSLKKAISMVIKNCNGEIASKIIDIYPKPQKSTNIQFDMNLVSKIIGIEIPKKNVINILNSLGIQTSRSNFSTLNCQIPSWRINDILLPQDIVEEIARIYGYHNLPSNILPTITKTKDQQFVVEEKIKTILKYIGFIEIANYSMIGKDLLLKLRLKPEDYLKISNPLSSDLVYMRPTLIPSILATASKEQKNKNDYNLFEIANIYIPQGQNILPEEIKMLTGISSKKFLEIKGDIETLLDELGIKNYEFKKANNISDIYNQNITAEILVDKIPIGTIGEINNTTQESFSIKNKVVVFDLELNQLITHSSVQKSFVPLPNFPPFIEDLAFNIKPETYVIDLINIIRSIDPLIKNVDLLDSHENTRTFRITYQSPDRTLTDQEVKKIREKIIIILKEKIVAIFKEK